MWILSYLGSVSASVPGSFYFLSGWQGKREVVVGVRLGGASHSASRALFITWNALLGDCNSFSPLTTCNSHHTGFVHSYLLSAASASVCMLSFLRFLTWAKISHILESLCLKICASSMAAAVHRGIYEAADLVFFVVFFAFHKHTCRENHMQATMNCAL